MDQILAYFDLVPRDLLMIPVGAAFFIAFYVFMSEKVLKPLIKLADTRQSLTSGAHDSARDTVSRAAQTESDFESRITQVRIDAMKIKLAQVDKAKLEATEIVEKAEAEAQEIVRAVRMENAQQLAAWKAEAKSKADDLVSAAMQQLEQQVGVNLQ